MTIKTLTKNYVMEKQCLNYEQTIDPTHNVRSLVDQEIKRIDDLIAANQSHAIALRQAETLRVNDSIEAERRRINEQLILRAEFSRELSVAEAKRIDAIRAVDVNAVLVANDKATAQAIV